MHNSVRNIAIAGSGNVAWHLANGLKLQGFGISGIWSREYLHAKELADRCDSVAYPDISGLCDRTDLIIIAVPDKVIENIACSIGQFEGIVVHTAGSVPIEVLKNNCRHYGVIYPLQTFSKAFPVDLTEVPFFLESSSPEVMQAIKAVALKLSARVYEAESHQRLMLHIAAVFAGNYSNLMYAIGDELLKNSNLPPEVLRPLILATALKATTGDPVEMQTGPARRNDTATIEKHIETLASMPEYADLYRLLANLISREK